MEAYIFIRAAANKIPTVKAGLAKLPGVRRANICWGVPDIIALAEVDDMKALRDLVLKKVQPLEGVTETDTHIVIE